MTWKRILATRAGRAIGSALLLVVACAFGLAAAEVLLRKTFFYSEGYGAPDPVYGWRLAAGARAVRTTPDYSVTVTTNSRGWRDLERGIAKPRETSRVAVLGDSFMEAYSVPMEDAFHRRLNTNLAEALGRRVEVLNFGVGGYGTLQEYLVYRHEATLYNPDVVLVGFYAANDVQNNSYALESAYYGTTGEYHVTSRPFLLGEEGWEVKSPDYQAAMEVFKGGGWWRESALHSVLIRARESLRLRRLDRRLWMGVFDCTQNDEYRKAWRTTRRILQKLSFEARDQAAVLAVFSVPSRAETIQQGLQKAGMGEEAGCTDYLAPTRKLAEILDSLNIPFIDLLPGFRERAKDEGPSLFHQDDPHWNARGHALAAELVAAELAPMMKKGS